MHLMPPRKPLSAFRSTPVTWCGVLLVVILSTGLSAAVDNFPFDDPEFKRAVTVYS